LACGSTFWVELPLTNAELRGIDLIDDYGSRKIPTSVQAATNAGGSTSSRIRGARVLVAEDNGNEPARHTADPRERRSLRYDRDNGEEALDALERGGYDIALFDLSMPVVSGLEALKMYKFASSNTIPILMLSAQCHRRNHASSVKRQVLPSLCKSQYVRPSSSTPSVANLSDRASSSRRLRPSPSKVCGPLLWRPSPR
jgi:two-component system sensor histidine kinase RpfC